MTDTDGRDRRTLGGQSHTNPYTDERFGDTQTYARGRTLAADGGSPDAAGRRREADGDGSEDPTADGPEETDARRADERGETLRDVDHTPRQNAPEASAAYMRGNEEDDERAGDPADRRGEGTRGGGR